MLHMPTPMLMNAALGAVVGQALRLTSGTFVVPDGVTSISVVCIGPGRSSSDTFPGAGGNLRYQNALPVTSGESLSVTVTAPSQFTGTSASLARGGTVLCRAADSGTQVGVGFNGGSWADSDGGGGGAATFGANGVTGFASPYRGGDGTSPYGSDLPPVVATGLNGAEYGGGAASGGNGGSGCVYIIYGSGRAFPNTLTGPIT